MLATSIVLDYDEIHALNDDAWQSGWYKNRRGSRDEGH